MQFAIRTLRFVLRTERIRRTQPRMFTRRDQQPGQTLGFSKTFLTNPDVPPTNNWAELNIRPAVVARNNSYGNRSAAGAETQGLLMSVFRSLELREENVVESVIARVQKNIAENHRLKFLPIASASED